MSCRAWRGVQPCIENQRGSPLGNSLSLYPPCNLDLCTENLGCETGSTTHGFLEGDYVKQEVETLARPQRNSRISDLNLNLKVFTQMKSSSGDSNYLRAKLPPPLTSISGRSCTRLEPHREGGRLLLKAVSLPSSNSYLHVERSEGRLTLRYMRHPSLQLEDEEEEKEEKEEKEEEDEAEENVDEEDDSSLLSCEKMKGGGEIEIFDKFNRHSRCKENGHPNKGIIWKPCLLASS